MMCHRPLRWDSLGGLKSPPAEESSRRRSGRPALDRLGWEGAEGIRSSVGRSVESSAATIENWKEKEKWRGMENKVRRGESGESEVEEIEGKKKLIDTRETPEKKIGSKDLLNKVVLLGPLKKFVVIERLQLSRLGN